ncbi:MAG: hypothetical protein IJU03_02250 [Thermoguttaceae bacterium]|nr:hypothetical protein [Thermoguttaceae bacterium]
MEDQSETKSEAKRTDALFYGFLYASFFAFLFYFWAFRYRDFLFVSQEYDLFLWRWSFVADSFSRLAGGANWLTSFLIQFFYYPALGAALLAGLGVFITYATAKLFHLHGWNLPLAFLPSLTLLAQITSVNYYLFERIDVAYVYSFTVKTSYMLAFALGVTRIASKRARLIALTLVFLATYPIFGFFALFAAFLCLLDELTRETSLTLTDATSGGVQTETLERQMDRRENVKSAAKRKNRTREKSKITPKTEPKKSTVETRRQRRNEGTLLLALAVLVSPSFFWLLYRNVVPNFPAMFTAGLWEESTLVAGRDPATHFLLTLATLALIVILGVFCVSTSLWRKTRKRNMNERSSKLAISVSILLIVGLCLLAMKLSYYSVNFRAMLGVARALEEKDWERVLELEAKVAAPINPLINARNLALARLDRLADEVFLRPLTPKSSPQLEAVSSFGMCGDRILYESGLTNAAERVAFNNYVTKRDRSRWAVKTLALCSIADGRYALAERYLYILQGTLFDDGFVDVALSHIASVVKEPTPYSHYVNARRQPSEAELAQFAKGLEEVRKRAPLIDELASSETVNHSLYGAIQNDDLSLRDRKEQENRLAFLLVMRHLPTFAKYLDVYLENVAPKETPPRYIQEAALFRADYPKFFNDPENAPRRPQNLASFDEEILNAYEKAKGILNDSSTNDQEKYERMSREFSDTFWFFYAFPIKTTHY